MDANQRADPNRKALTQIALALGAALRREVAFLGGAAIGLLITDAAAPPVRVTKDVDCIVEVASRADYDTRVRGLLLERGFQERVGEGIPVCAWRYADIRLDVMPTHESVLGFSNRWYEAALRSAERFDLGAVAVRLVSAPYLLATKLEAFYGRGAGDYYGSHDLEDLVALVNGRPSLAQEVRAADPALRTYLAAEIGELLGGSDFEYALPGHLPERGREQVVRERLRAIAHLGS